MCKKVFLPLLISIFLVILIPACDKKMNDVNKPSENTPSLPTKIAEITAVEIKIIKSNPLQLHIITTGNVSSSGWSKPSLEPFAYEKPPRNGIYEFNFNAVPPVENSAQMISPIEVEYTMNPLPNNLLGVRIHGARNNKKGML